MGRPFARHIPDEERQVAQNETSLVQSLQESLALTRLPTPEPSVFSGDPLKFTEWSISFKALIERRCSDPADRLFCLQKYIAGEAKSSLEGSFYRKDEEAYQQAWDRLNARYGHSFVVQRAFREKLNGWPKIGGKEYLKLREFSDFLQTCSNAMPHIKGLQVLNDCEENQKILVKLPDWVSSRWNRYVTEQLDRGNDYPSFHEFASFISKESRIACNPVSSLHALRHSAEAPSREMKRSKANTFATNVNPPIPSNSTAKSDLGEFKLRDAEKPKKWNTPTQNSNNSQCVCCGENHSIHKCKRLMDMSVEDKKKCILEKKLCFACLRKGHNSKDCRNRAMCGICRKSHPTPLHEVRSTAASTQGAVEESTLSLSCCVSGGEGGSTSMIVPVWISTLSAPDTETLVYALLDTQSSHTFVDQEVCEKLQATMEPVKLKLSTMMGRDSVVKSQRVCELKVRGFSSNISISLPPSYTRDFIPLDRAHIPTCQTANKWKHLVSIAREIPPLMDCGVGLLIGYDCSRAIIPRRVITGGDYEPYAIETDLGWSIVGSAPQRMQAKDVTGFCHRVSVREVPPITPFAVIKALESDFADTKPGDRSISQEDICFLQILKDRIQQNKDGHLEMPLPFRARPHLPDNKKLALVRLKHLKRKLDRDPKFKIDYGRFMDSIFKDGDAEKVENQAELGKVWYIPHQGVYHPRKPGKIRVVFDCSARYEGTSLNDHLLTGPDLTNSLTAVLCRFRKYPIAIMCDVEKMFHRFHVSEDDRDYLRFLWWENGDTNSEPREYRMKVHLFGASSSPGCANYGMKHLASQCEKEYPSAASFVRKHFYVDDGLISVESVGKAIERVKEAQAVCAKGKLHLHKFLSNSREVLDSVDVAERATEVKNVDLNHDDLPVQRVLGIRWNVENDSFSFKVSLEEKPATRRGILSIVASLYDPLGFLAPVILEGKRVLQEMCQRGTGWDEPLPKDLKLSFLWEREIATKQATSDLLVGDPEVRTTQMLKVDVARQFDIQKHLLRFSRWTTAVNIIARIQRLAKRIRTAEPLNVEERKQAAQTLVKLAQQDAFQEELNTLSQKLGRLPCNHQLFQLDPFLQDGIMRVGGRLRKASVPLDLRHPVILPKDGAVTNLIIAHHHSKIQHQGRGQTLNALRASGYWIAGGSKAVARYIRQCVQCRRARTPPEEQRMADLPSDHVDPTPPFTYCGMDCFGPFHTKQGRKDQKRYGLLFTCFCSRAVHIEMLEDLTTDAFINALRCFIALRGAVRHIRSDQGTNFMGARNEMAKALKELDKERVTAYLAENQCDFQMNTPHSSHAGGAWERQIRTVRSVLSMVLACSVGRLDDVSLRTFLYEAMCIVNNRPLTVDNINDPKSLEPLTPNHLITMKSSIPLPPPGKFVKEDLYAKKRWRRVQYLTEQFWHRWRKEYLANIALRQRWHTLVMGR
ncbi:unnamed protein product [Oreochromis niloticus]|nr:unnamed protein product [Mustela putorius furo]